MRKPTKKTVGNRLDNLARQICKINANYTCQKCGMVGGGDQIQWAHIERRGKKGSMMRWSEHNCLALCSGPYSSNCHYWFDNNKVASTEWLKEKYPEKHAWLMEPVNGVPRSQTLFTDIDVGAMLVLEEELKQRLEELKR